MSTIRKRGNKFQVQIRRHGFPDIAKTFTQLRDAKEWARHIEIAQDRNELANNHRELGLITLGELVRRYRDEIAPKHKGGGIEVIILNSFLEHDICTKTLAQLSTSDFASYRDTRLKEVKPATLKRQLTPIRSMLNTARDEWNIPLKENPLDKLKLNAPDNKRERRLQAGEDDRVLEAARTRQNPWIEKVIIFAIETAMRRGEILALEWSEVNLDRRSVTILEAKNGHSRTIQLTPKAYAQ